MSQTQPTQTEGTNGIDRREFLRRTAAATTAAASVSYGSLRLDHGPVQSAEAVPLPLLGVAAAGYVGTDWLLREYDPLGMNTPSEGLSPEALQQSIHSTATARQSSNASTFIDNRNIVSASKDTAYAEAKIAAFDALNDGQSQSEVESQSVSAVDDYETTVLLNFFRSWNESVEEHESIFEIAEEYLTSTMGAYLDNETYELPDGSEIDIHHPNSFGSSPPSWSPTGDANVDANDTGDFYVETDLPEHNDIRWLIFEEWNEIYEEITSTFTEVRDEVILFVDGVYSEVQAGDIDVAELLTPREIAAMTAEDEDYPQALADLTALNIPTDYERQAQVYLPEPDATLFGTLSYSGDGELEVGTVNPDNLDGSVYLTYDVSQGSGTWSDYEAPVEAGMVIFTDQPYSDVVFDIDTIAGETATVTASDFTQDDGDWTVDVSDQLDDPITEIEAVQYHAESGDINTQTVALQNEFEILSFTDGAGNEFDSTEFQNREPHTDDNYITQEEWQESMDRQQELIDQYEDAQGGGGIDLSGLSVGGLSGELVALIAAAAAAALALGGNNGGRR